MTTREPTINVRPHRYPSRPNYTLPPVPRPATAAPAPPPPGPDLTALARPALTGITDFAALTASVNLAWEAAREERLHLPAAPAAAATPAWTARPPDRLSLHGHVLATFYRQPLAMPCHLIGALLGVDRSTISLATCCIALLLNEEGITITPPAPASAPWPRHATTPPQLGSPSPSRHNRTPPRKIR